MWSTMILLAFHVYTCVHTYRYTCMYIFTHTCVRIYKHKHKIFPQCLAQRSSEGLFIVWVKKYKNFLNIRLNYLNGPIYSIFCNKGITELLPRSPWPLGHLRHVGKANEVAYFNLLLKLDLILFASSTSFTTATQIIVGHI